MKIKYLILVIAPACIVLAAVLYFAFNSPANRDKNAAAQVKTYQNLYVCSMHPYQASEGPGLCKICGMNLSRVEGHIPGNPLPQIERLFVSEDNPMSIYYLPGQPPDSLMPVTESPFYQPRETKQLEAERLHSKVGANDAAEPMLWTCGMHPEVISDKPGVCPICQMELTPLKTTSGAAGKTIQIDPATVQNIGVLTEKVERRNLSLKIRSNGIVKPAEDAEFKVNARVSGWVEKLYVSRTGDLVEKGQPLLELYSPELVAAQEEFLLALEKSPSVKWEGVDLLQAAKRKFQLWNIADEQIENLSRNRRVERTMTITSPARGIVLMKNVVQGSAVKPGMDLYHIADLDKVWVIAQVYEYELPWITVGDNVLIVSPYEPSLNLKGGLEFIYPYLDSKSRTAEVRISVPNPALRLKPEMYVDVIISARQKLGVLSVPKQAVLRSGKRDIVFIDLGGGKFEPRQVHLGMETDEYYEILHNLREGESVVTSAQFLLDSEAKLQEAVKKRLEMRKKAGLSPEGEMKMEEPSPHQGHQH